MESFEWTEPGTLDAVSAALADGGGAVKAGGVDLLDLMKEGLLAPKRLVGLGKIRELRTIESTAEGGVRIGARATLAEVSQHACIRSLYRALADAAGQAATPEVRSIASLGGNLLQRSRCGYYRSKEFDCLRKGGQECFARDGRSRYHAVFGNGMCAMVHPSTPATALVALGAQVVLRNPDGQERRVPIDEFFVSPETALDRETVRQQDEVLTFVELPPVPKDFRSRHHKQGERQSHAWPIADVAVAFRYLNGRLRGLRVVLGSAAPTPIRRPAAENLLEGKKLTVALADRAAEAALHGATPLSENGYKVLVFRSIIRRLLLDAVQPVA